MTLFSNKKRIKNLEADTRDALLLLAEEIQSAFNGVSKDINLALDALDEQASDVKKIKAQLRKDTVVTRYGDTATTISGRLKAIADHLGLSFVANPKKVVPASIDIVKTRKVNKK